MLNLIRNLKMIDYKSKKTQKTYAILIIMELIISSIVTLITVKNYDKIKRSDDNEEMDDDKFEIETAKIQEQNMKIWCISGIAIWIATIIAAFKMDYTTLGQWWDNHFSK